MAAEGLDTTTPRAQGDWHIPQLVPRGWLRTNQVHHPAVLDEAKRQSDDIQLRLADRITAFAGSMKFGWIHAAFSPYGWCFLEKRPWSTLTLVVSLDHLD